MSMVSAVKPWKMISIGGEWKEGSSDRTATVRNKFSDETMTEIKLANKQDIDNAYKAAKKAQEEWAKVSPFERAALMDRVAELIGQRQEEIVTMLVEESGSSQLKAAIEVGASIGDVKEAAKYPSQMDAEIHPSIIPGKENRIYRNPVGVVGAITPWNWPFYLSIRVVAPAIACGNGIVLKVDSQTPITGGLMIAQIFEEAGIPKGLLSVVAYDIEEVGDYFVEHPIPRVISFTGSTAAGRKIAEVAGKHLKKVALELGGNNAFIILDDANVDQAVASAAFGKYLHQGQICIATNRFIVDRKIYPEFVAKFKEATVKVKAGNPAEADTIIGPLINKKQIERVVNLVNQSINEGAKLELEGKVVGNVIEPYILTDVTNEMSIAKNEIFGPVAAIIPVDSEEEAIRIANDSDFGLTGAVHSGSLERAINVAQQIVTGMIHVNDQTVNVESHMPFGGEKSSGLGRHCGESALEEFTTVKWISVQREARQYPFS
ncbi:aldehyde dehydrogenase family protein [Paenibacillus abyssi]|uniref:3-sulfolactaldehyde dehydrogenase n=1 Tax=Paenibacillus abyssi TaxID=1340531 RepID=A0A917G706_9BACL|nr:aldehyde dehydrogenase family protein [Paenibacillus abyssi]GGG25862.1 putative aldehyde dehydrogenase YfmT [Paenibacillus abyssi]